MLGIVKRLRSSLPHSADAGSKPRVGCRAPDDAASRAGAPPVIVGSEINLNGRTHGGHMKLPFSKLQP
eukprot:5109347-Pleurochrysis_carterae.AAC.7